MKTELAVDSPRSRATTSGFTLIELLVVIAIIAILAAISFPVFNKVREQARQSSTMSKLHSVYVGATLFHLDEGRWPPTLFPYAEIALPPGSTPPSQVALSVSPNLAPMDKATGYYSTGLDVNGNPISFNHGFLFQEQVKSYTDFTNDDNLVKDQKAVTNAVYPGTANTVNWLSAAPSPKAGCTATYTDPDLPAVSGQTYAGQPKLYYTMDSMDIGPQLKDDGTTTGNYELHYSPDWTHVSGLADGNGCPGDIDANGNYVVTQLKYKNPPADRTVLTYVTQHTATTGSPSVLVLLLSGTARKVNYRFAVDGTLPLNYK